MTINVVALVVAAWQELHSVVRLVVVRWPPGETVLRNAAAVGVRTRMVARRACTRNASAAAGHGGLQWGAQSGGGLLFGAWPFFV